MLSGRGGREADEEAEGGRRSNASQLLCPMYVFVEKEGVFVVFGRVRSTTATNNRSGEWPFFFFIFIFIFIFFYYFPPLVLSFSLYFFLSCFLSSCLSTRQVDRIGGGRNGKGALEQDPSFFLSVHPFVHPLVRPPVRPSVRPSSPSSFLLFWVWFCFGVCCFIFIIIEVVDVLLFLHFLLRRATQSSRVSLFLIL